MTEITGRFEAAKSEEGRRIRKFPDNSLFPFGAKANRTGFQGCRDASRKRRNWRWEAASLTGNQPAKPRKCPRYLRSNPRNRQETGVAGGQSGIRTHETLPSTHFPGVRLRPLGHLSVAVLLARRSVISKPPKLAPLPITAHYFITKSQYHIPDVANHGRTVIPPP